MKPNASRLHSGTRHLAGRTGRRIARIDVTASSVALVVAVTAAGCGGGAAPADKAGRPVAPTVDVVRVVEQPVDVVVSMPGQLEPFEEIAVYAKVTGFVRRVAVDRGSKVREGDVLVQLDAPEIDAQRAEGQSRLQAAEAQLAAATAKADAETSTYDRLKAASATPGVVAGNDLVVSQKSAEAARAQVAAARDSVQAAREAAQSLAQLDGYLRVTAPFSGVVTERNVHPGALVGPASGAGSGTPMLRLENGERLRLVVPVPEAYAASVKEGSPVRFTVSAYPGRTFTGTTARIAHSIDEKTRTMAVEVDVANADRTLTSGAYCQVQWPVRRPQPSLFVPNGSVASTTDRTFVVRFKSGVSEWVDVRTGLVAGPLTEVFGDLRAGDVVAARGTDELRSGTSVQVREAASRGRQP
jgi:membrane fusion protein, multidrug efflux system